MRDLYSGVRAARELSLMGSISAFAPIVAPMIGGVLQTQFGWRANFILMAVAAVIAFAMASRLLPETLRRRSDEPFSLKWLGKGYISLLRHRSFVAYLAILTISYAGLFAWISGAAAVLEGIYGMSAVTFGFTFALGAGGYMAGAAGAARLVQRLGLDRMMGLGVSLLAAGGTGLAALVAAQIPNGLWLIVMMAISCRSRACDAPGYGRRAHAVSATRRHGGFAAWAGPAVGCGRCGRGYRRLSRTLRVASGRRCVRRGLAHFPGLGVHAWSARARSFE